MMIVECENCYTRSNVYLDKDGTYICKPCAAKIKEAVAASANTARLKLPEWEEVWNHVKNKVFIHYSTEGVQNAANVGIAAGAIETYNFIVRQRQA